MSDSGAIVVQDISLLERLLGQASRFVKAWGTYLLAIGAPIVGWIQFRKQLEHLDFGPLDPYKLPIIFGAPLAIAGLNIVIDVRKQRADRERRLWASKGPPLPGYFRLTPYQAGDRFTRADEAHERILEWLQATEAPLLYLTGRSGSGKSSILNAYVIPALKAEPTNACVVEARVYNDPISDITAALVAPGLVWNRPPDTTRDLPQLLERATQHLKGRRLILILDQFEEFAILHEDEADRGPLREFLSRIVGQPIAGLTVLLTLREDFLGPTREALALQRPELEKTWQQVSLFVHGAAVEFLRESHKGGLDANLINRVLEEAADIEENPGLYRPITLNMLGLVIAETTGRSKAIAPGQVLLDYLRRQLRDPLVRDFAPRVLQLMLTRFGTKRPMTETEIETATKLRRLDIESTLGWLKAAGLIRRFGHDDALRWEIAHDFVARFLAVVLAGWRVTLWRATRPWLAPGLVVLWLVTLAAGVPLYLDWIGGKHDKAVAALGLLKDVKITTDDEEPQLFSIEVSSWDNLDLQALWLNLALLRERIVGLDLKNRGPDIDRNIDFGPLASLTNLQTLILWRTQVDDVTPLQGLTSLQTLRLGNTQVDDVTPLQGLTSLQTLGLGKTQVDDVTPLQGLTSLQTLDLGGTQVDDVTPLQGLTSLQTLRLGNTQVDDVKPLQGLTSLQTLDLRRTQVDDVTPLKSLTKLQTLFLNGTQVDDVTPLQGLTSLQTLGLGKTQVDDVTPLQDLTNLQTLSLGGTQFDDVTPLRGLTNLQWLDLRGTQVDDVTPLKSLTKLQTLFLNGTQVDDVTPLRGLTNLQKLDLRGTRVSNNLGRLRARFPGVKIER